MSAVWVRELASSFWRDAGNRSSRDLLDAIALATPLSVVVRPDLSVDGIDTWLRRNGVPCVLRTNSRALRACLVAHGGSGLVFVDGDDPDPEQRFSLAHELAHFLHDYRQPRLEAAAMYGPDVLDVFEGLRPARRDERIHALLARIPIGFHVHLMERKRGVIVDPQIVHAERDANRLAFELLAPEDEVLSRVGAGPDRRGRTEDLLEAEYGLPPTAAREYARLIARDEPVSFVRHLRAVRS